MQTTGETRDAIIEDDNKHITKIIETNKHRKSVYWIVVFAKPSKQSVDGKPTLMKHIKAYSDKPSPQVGMITGEVNNAKGTVKWDINMPQVPFDFDALRQYGGDSHKEAVIETTSIPNAYLTR